VGGTLAKKQQKGGVVAGKGGGGRRKTARAKSPSETHHYLDGVACNGGRKKKHTFAERKALLHLWKISCKDRGVCKGGKFFAKTHLESVQSVLIFMGEGKDGAGGERAEQMLGKKRLISIQVRSGNGVHLKKKAGVRGKKKALLPEKKGFA